MLTAVPPDVFETPCSLKMGGVEVERKRERERTRPGVGESEWVGKSDDGDESERADD